MGRHEDRDVCTGVVVVCKPRTSPKWKLAELRAPGEGKHAGKRRMQRAQKLTRFVAEQATLRNGPSQGRATASVEDLTLTCAIIRVNGAFVESGAPELMLRFECDVLTLDDKTTRLETDHQLTKALMRSLAA